MTISTTRRRVGDQVIKDDYEIQDRQFGARFGLEDDLNIVCSLWFPSRPRGGFLFAGGALSAPTTAERSLPGPGARRSISTHRAFLARRCDLPGVVDSLPSERREQQKAPVMSQLNPNLNHAVVEARLRARLSEASRYRQRFRRSPGSRRELARAVRGLPSDPGVISGRGPVVTTRPPG